MKIFKKEQKVVDLALEYLEVSTQCVASGEQAVSSYLAGKLGSASEIRQDVRQLEARADELRRAIGDMLYSGAYLPLIRGDIYSLVDCFDRVPNAAEACATFFISERPDVPDEYVEAFRDILGTSFGTIHPLREAVKEFFDPKGRLEDVRAHTVKTSVEESIVDDSEWELTNAIFDSPLDLARKLHLRKALERIVHVSDRAEDAGDQLGLVAVKSVT
jgi:predicted phosphate transport protein (TIGR00153 family)